MTLCLGPRAAAPPPTPSGGERLDHVTCAPSTALAPFIEHYWLSRWDRRDTVAREASALLDPSVHLQVQDGCAQVMGVMRGAFRTRIEGRGFVVGVKFRVGGFFPFVQRPVTEWTDRVVPAREIFATDDACVGALSGEIAACDGGAAEHREIITRHLDAVVDAVIPERDDTVDEVAELVARIAASADIRRIGDLVQASGRSERSLHRLFARYVGVSPAWIIRRYRLHEAARRLTAMPPADASDVAWELGYADQAHFIRDFRATIGVTPGTYVRQRTAR